MNDTHLLAVCRTSAQELPPLCEGEGKMTRAKILAYEKLTEALAAIPQWLQASERLIHTPLRLGGRTGSCGTKLHRFSGWNYCILRQREATCLKKERFPFYYCLLTILQCRLKDAGMMITNCHFSTTVKTGPSASALLPPVPVSMEG